MQDDYLISILYPLSVDKEAQEDLFARVAELAYVCAEEQGDRDWDVFVSGCPEADRDNWLRKPINRAYDLLRQGKLNEAIKVLDDVRDLM